MFFNQHKLFETRENNLNNKQNRDTNDKRIHFVENKYSIMKSKTQ